MTPVHAAVARSVLVAACLAACDARPATQRADLDGSPPPDSALLAQVEEGQAAYFASDYDAARALLERVQVDAMRAGDSVTAAHALTWLGLTAMRQGRYVDAREHGENALALKLSRRMEDELSRSYNALGLLAQAEGRFTDALELFDRSIAAARQVGDTLGIGRGLGNSGLVHRDQGDYARAREAFAAHLEIARAAGGTRAEGNALVNLAMVEIQLGDPLDALRALAEARQLYATVGHPAGEEAALGQLGTAFEVMGDPYRAILHFDSALTIARRHGLRREESENLQLLADLFGQVGDHTRALDHLTQARALAGEIGTRSELGDIARSVAWAYSALGRYDLARAAADEAVALHRQSGARLEELLDHLVVAELAQRQGAGGDADRAIGEAERLARRTGGSLARAHLTLGAARVADLRGDSRLVMRRLRDGADDIGRLGPSGGWERYALESRAHARDGRLEEAAAAGRLAVQEIERVRGRIASAPLRLSFTSERASVYAELVLALLRLGRVDEAFEVADAARGRAMLEHIAAGRDGMRAQTAAPLADAEQLLRRIDWLIARLQQADTLPERERSAGESERLSELTRALAEARRTYEGAMQRAWRADPAGVALAGAGRVTGAGVQGALAADEVLVQYLVTGDRLIGFVVTRDTIAPFTGEVTAEELVTRARLVHDLVGRRGATRASALPSLQALHELVVGPAERTGLLANARTLIVIPHGPLVHVPFAALADGEGRHLVERHALVTLASASALEALRGAPASQDNVAHVFAPFPEQLPSSRLEARSIARSLSGATTMFGPRADEQAVRRALALPGVVHVASHGVLNESTPIFSRIELASPPRGARASSNDGRLEVHELLGMTVRSRLVFLSGCETAAGVAWSNAFRRGQDFATLAQAFLYAGATDVIATLWRIDDEGAAAFASRFYAELATQAPVDALAATQRALLRDDRYSSPRLWAAYTLSGAGRRQHPATNLAAAARRPSHTLLAR